MTREQWLVELEIYSDMWFFAKQNKMQDLAMWAGQKAFATLPQILACGEMEAESIFRADNTKIMRWTKFVAHAAENAAKRGNHQ